MSDKGSASEQRGSGLLPVGIILGLLAVAAVFLSLRAGDAPDAADVTAVVETVVPAATPLPDETADATQAEPDAAQAPADAVAVDTAPAETAAQAAPEAAAEASDENTAPSIDEVRVDNDGLVVVAGRGVPGSKVDVLVDGQVVSSAQVDTSGAFAALGNVDASTGARSLTLQSGTGDKAIASAEEIILAPTGTGRASANEAAQDQSGSAAPETVAESETTDQEQVTEQAALPATTDRQTETQSPQIETITTAADPGVPGAEGQEMPESEESPLAAAGDAEPTTADAPSTAPVTEAPASRAETVVASVEADVSSDEPPAESPQAATVAPEAPPSPEQPSQTADPLPRPTEDVAPSSGQIAVLRSDAEGVRLQRIETAPAARVMLDTIGYNDAGDVQLSGRASAEAVEVRIYLDNRGVGRLPVEAGAWQGTVTGVAPGVYRLRIDAMSAEGTVSSRIETPFKREAPAVLAAAAETNEAAGPVRAVTVQAGDTLWAIARDRYGEGILYVQVFEANRGSIRDPDLIYPGQIFDLPDD